MREAFYNRFLIPEDLLDRVDSEGEGDDGHCAGPDDHGLHVEPHEGQEAAEGLHDVGVVSARLPDHAAQLCVAVGAHLIR